MQVHNLRTLKENKIGYIYGYIWTFVSEKEVFVVIEKD